ncbi:hypothetical protein C1646_760913 [Rhizophagus diaphanus]|nr:hypothetical protein C1646_760913 [Rhizophagus diaphanus] [Rhizophagus sp. MUCL 43196]
MQSTSDFQQQQQEKISKIRRPGIVANFIYKVVKPATYTSTFTTDAINILTGQKSILLFFLLFFTLNFFQCILLFTKMFFKKYQQQEKISKIRRPGVVANFIYKVVELATYTSAFVTDAINILNGNILNTEGHSTRRNYGYDDIDDDDENVYDHKKKDVSTWGENVETVEDEELPPPYDNFSSSTTTFATTNTTTTEAKPSLIISTSSSKQDYPTTQTEIKPSLTIDYPTIQTSQRIVSTSTHSPTNSTTRRRKFRVRRGRRFVRRKSSSIDMSIIKNTEDDVDSFNNTDSHTDNNVDVDDDVDSFNNTNSHTDNNVEDDVDIIFERLNYKISNMIAEGEAALNSKVEITEVDMILAEEKEHEERIMKEFGIQTPIQDQDELINTFIEKFKTLNPKQQEKISIVINESQVAINKHEKHFSTSIANGTEMGFDDITNHNASAVAKSGGATFENFFSIHDGFNKYDEMNVSVRSDRVVNAIKSVEVPSSTQNKPVKLGECLQCYQQKKQVTPSKIKNIPIAQLTALSISLLTHKIGVLAGLIKLHLYKM